MLLVLAGFGCPPWNTSVSPLLGMTPNQFPGSFQLAVVPPPFQISVSAEALCAKDSAAPLMRSAAQRKNDVLNESQRAVLLHIVLELSFPENSVMFGTGRDLIRHGIFRKSFM